MGMASANIAQSTQPQPQPSGKGGAIQSQNTPVTGVTLPGQNQTLGNQIQDWGNQAQSTTNANPTNTGVQPMGKGGSVNFPGQGGQPRFGRPNTYSNTVGPWDNASIGQPRQTQSGKGKGY
jgi:hypothetical protein